jgi:major membrane immunogen (membrane-anchored lipoprotein)
MRNKFLPCALAALLIVTMLVLSGCAPDGRSAMVDGYYTAQMADFSRGWKEYVTICVNGGSIASVEYNAVNPSGFIKSWDMAYMRSMSAAQGMYPNLYTREYARQLMEAQSPDGIDTLSGATLSGKNFRLLADAVIRMATLGDDEVAVVDLPEDAAQPAMTPTATAQPTATPTATVQPTVKPAATVRPTVKPTATVRPTLKPTAMVQPTVKPTATIQPAASADAVSSATISGGNP